MFKMLALVSNCVLYYDFFIHFTTIGKFLQNEKYHAMESDYKAESMGNLIPCKSLKELILIINNNIIKILSKFLK